jgi:exosome complex component RRP42
MKLNQKTVRELANQGKRMDGRGLKEYRDISLETGYINETAEASAKVEIGDTKVIVGMSTSVEEPYDDKPGEGTLVTNAELAPMASREFESGPPQEEGVELARVVDRGIREAPAVDFEELCIEEGEKVYTLFLDIHVLNDDGNLIDASSLGAMACLKTGFLPAYSEEDGLLRDQPSEGKDIPLNSLPITATGHHVDGNVMFDPTAREEDADGSRVTVSITEEGNVVAMQKGGESTISSSDITEIIDIADEKTQKMRSMVQAEL